MRLVIDKDISEIQLLQEAYEKNKPSYTVMAVENGEKFVYGKKLTFNEAREAVCDLAFDPMFGNEVDAEIVEVVSESSSSTIWSSNQKTIVKESVMFEADDNNGNGGEEKKQGLWDKMKGAAKGALDKLKGAWNVTKQLTGQFSKDMLNKWRNASYFTKDGKITGLGYKVMTGQAKNTVPVDTDDKTGDITKVWEVVKSNVTQGLKKQGMTVQGEIEAFVKNDKDPIQLTATVTDKDGNEQKLMMSQDGQVTNGDGQNANNGGDNGGNNANGGGNNGGGNAGGATGNGGGGANTQQITPDQAQKNPKAALGNLATRVANLEKEVGIAAESSWNYNNEQVFNRKEGYERQTIRRFFNEMNDPSVKNIKFVRPDGTFKLYDTSRGSEAYSEFKKDFRESTSKVEKGGIFRECKVVVESAGSRSRLNGFKFSDFGVADDFDSESRTIVIKESVVKDDTVVKDDNPEDTASKKKVNDPSVVQESTIEDVAKNPEPNGFTVELDKKDPLEEVKALLASLNKYNGVEPKKPDDIQDGGISTGVTTYPDVPTFETPKKQEPLDMPDQNPPKTETPEVVKEADDDEGGDDAGGGGDDAGGGDADPFGGGDDAGGGGAGDDAGGDADPFGGGGDDVGGDAGGGDDADPFGGGGDDAGGDAGGGGGTAGDAVGGTAEGGADAGAAPTDDPNSPEGEPAASDAVNTDAEGNPKSQYNINVTKPFNVNDDFSLNEEEQKEFFGKIDQLVKIPDMDNYSLYLYQITPENMNLDDVHYIQALYDLSVKLGLLEDVYADSNLLEKYSSYKYSVMKDGETDATKGEDALKVQEQNNPIWQTGRVLSEAKVPGVPTVQTDNEEKRKASLKIGSSEKDDERRGPKDTKLDLDKNGAPKPVVIDTTKEGWDSLNGKEHGKAIDSTVEGAFHGLGWIATFKAMQFGSPRYLSLYIKKNGDEKAEKQCEDYLKRLSYTDIEFVNIDEVDPYEYVYRTYAGMKSPEQVRTEKYANEAVPVTYFESKDTDTKVPESIPGDIQRDIKRVITKLNSEIRGTKQFNFLKECGIEKPQIDHLEFLTHYKTAQVNETLSETTYKFIFKPNDNMISRMFFSNLKEKLFKYLGTFATKYNMDCDCEETPKAVTISFTRGEMGNPTYDLETMVDTTPSLDEALVIAAQN